MTLFRTILIGAVALGTMAIATPAQAHDDRNDHHRHHHHWHNGRDAVVIQQTTPSYGYVDNSNVSVAFGGHLRHQPHHRWHRGDR